MKRVAIFGNAGGGKSTLARRLSALTGLPLHVLDKMQFREGGAAIPRKEYLHAHADVLRQDAWIIDGFGCNQTVWERLEAADTLVHVDLPLMLHGLWVTKRLIGGLFSDPEGWPKGSPVIASSMQSYRVLWSCHRHLTPRYRAFVAAAAQRKEVFHLRSRRELSAFLETARQQAGANA